MLQLTLLVDAPPTYSLADGNGGRVTRASPWRGLTLSIKLDFPPNYPHSAPSIEFEGGRMYHPTVNRGACAAGGARSIRARGHDARRCHNSHSSVRPESMHASVWRALLSLPEYTCHHLACFPLSLPGSGELCQLAVTAVFNSPSAKVEHLIKELLLKLLSEPSPDSPLDEEASREMADVSGPGVVAFESKARSFATSPH